MELRQRKRINNIQKFNSGVGSSTQTLQGATQGIGGDLNGMQAYRTQLINTPMQSEINSINTSKAQSYNMNAQTQQQSTGGMIGNIATMGNQDIAYTYNTIANPVQASDLMGKSGTSVGTIHGVNFQQQNDINDSQLLKENTAEGLSNTLNMMNHGAAAGGPGWGALIGGAAGLSLGLFNYFKRRSALKKAIWNANQLVQKKNIFARSGAYSEALQNDYYQDNGDTKNQLLNANRGKD